MRRLRRTGHTPAVLYGHGQETIHLTIDTRDVDSVIRAGNLIVELKGDVNESALIKDVQWDPFGSEVLHLDLARVDVTEQIEVTIAIDLRGDAPGTKEGGVVKHLMHEVTIRCPAKDLPDKLELNINELELNQSLTLADIEKAPSVEIVGELDDVVVSCTEPDVQAEEEEPAEGEAVAEPEVIGRKPEEEEGGED